MITWPSVLKGRDVLACAPTGSGKTLAYMLPLLLRLGRSGGVGAKAEKKRGGGEANGGVRALVLAPTRELAEQIKRETMLLCRGVKWRVLVLTKANANMNTFKSTDTGKRCLCDILVATPMRLLHLLRGVSERGGDGKDLLASGTEGSIRPHARTCTHAHTHTPKHAPS